MELRHLRYFTAVAEELHFGRAAARLHLAQPPLSQQIRALEAEVGAELFARTSRKVALTPAGEAFLEHARAALERADAALEAARSVADGRAGRLDLGFVNPAMDGFLSRVVADFRRDHPGVALSLREMSSPAQVDELRAGTLHAGFIRYAGQDLRGLEFRVVHREPYVAALPPDHPLARRKRVPLALLAREPLILAPRAVMPGLHEAMLAALRATGHEPVVAQEALSKHTTLSLVAARLGLALVPASCAAWRRRGVVLREVEGELPVIELALVCPAGTLTDPPQPLRQFLRGAFGPLWKGGEWGPLGFLQPGEAGFAPL